MYPFVLPPVLPFDPYYPPVATGRILLLVGSIINIMTCDRLSSGRSVAETFERVSSPIFVVGWVSLARRLAIHSNSVGVVSMPENPADVVARWKKAMVASTGKMKEKIMALQTSPMQKAIAAKDAYVNGIMQSVEDGTWEAGLRSVNFEDWKKKTAEVGTARIAAGVEAAAPKMQKFMEQLLPYTESVKRQIDAMPSGTPEDRIQRMIANARLMAQFKPRKS